MAKPNAALLARSKTQAWKKLSEAMENNSQMALRKFWSTIQHLRKRRSAPLTLSIIGTAELNSEHCEAVGGIHQRTLQFH